MKGIRHHLLDMASPRRVFSAYDFVREGRRAIADIHARGKLPIICGGTGFYIDALLGRIPLADSNPDSALRAKLERKTAAQLFALLQKKDAPRAARMDTPSERNNKARLIRALEIAHSLSPEQSVKNAYAKSADKEEAPTYQVEWIGIDWSDEALRTRIHARLHARMKAGMVSEVRRLHAQGLPWKRMEALGLEYRYISRFLRGLLTRSEMLEQLESEIWHYAKRQRTWWKRNKEIAWTIHQ